MSVLSWEVITEWAARGQRGKRRQSRADEFRAHVEIGEPIKAELIALTAPLVEFIQKHGLAGVSIPMQDSAEAKDIHVDCFPLYEEIECVLDKWGSIYIEVDAATSRQRIADSHEAQRQRIAEKDARIAELEATNAEICKRAKVWQDEVDRLEAEREHAVRVMGDTVKQHATQGESLAAALKELNEARNMCPFSFNRAARRRLPDGSLVVCGAGSFLRLYLAAFRANGAGCDAAGVWRSRNRNGARVMPIEKHTYSEICKRECEWCAETGPATVASGTIHKVYPMHSDGERRSPKVLGPFSEYFPCTAPTKDAVIERLSEKLRVAREALKEIVGCGPSTLDTASRIARRALAALDATQPEAPKENI